jgi:hypothetical protein
MIIEYEFVEYNGIDKCFKCVFDYNCGCCVLGVMGEVWEVFEKKCDGGAGYWRIKEDEHS